MYTHYTLIHTHTLNVRGRKVKKENTYTTYGKNVRKN